MSCPQAKRVLLPLPLHPPGEHPRASSPNPISGRQLRRKSTVFLPALGACGTGAVASSEAGYRTHRPQARTGEEVSAGRNEAGSPRLVAEDGEQSKLVLPSSSLCPRCPGAGKGGLHSRRSFRQTLTFIARGRVVAPAPGCRSASPPAAARRHVAGAQGRGARKMESWARSAADCISDWPCRQKQPGWKTGDEHVFVLQEGRPGGSDSTFDPFPLCSLLRSPGYPLPPSPVTQGTRVWSPSVEVLRCILG